MAPQLPEHWFPLVPVTAGSSKRSIRLRRGRVLLDAGGTTPAPLGRLLTPERKLLLFEEEVPAGGVSITRAWQLARGSDGAVLHWIGRRKRPGRAERPVALAFDTIEEPHS